MKKVLVYSHDTFGLGNIRRMLEISKHLTCSDPDLSILIISGSPMLHAFRIPPRIDYVKLPCLRRKLDGKYDVKFLNMNYQDTIQLRSNLILSAALDFKPDLILVDKKPFGVSNELFPALDALLRRSQRPKLVLLLRDILDSPKVTTQVWKRNGYHEAVSAFYDLVLVLGSPEIFDLRTEYQFPPESAEKVRFCGYLKRERSPRTRDEIREELGIGSEALVLVTVGGGEDGRQLLSCYLQGLENLGDDTGVRTMMLCGPEMSNEDRGHILKTAARCPSLLVKDFTDDIMSYMDAADLVVSMGGYNTICEILTLKKRAIVVPRAKPVQEQWIRARRMARQKLLRVIHPAKLSPKRLIGVVQEELSKGNVRPSALYQVDLGGLSRIGRCVSALLAEEAVQSSAEQFPQGDLKWGAI